MIGRGGTEQHVEVSLSKILSPKIAPDVQLAPKIANSLSKNNNYRMLLKLPTVHHLLLHGENIKL